MHMCCRNPFKTMQDNTTNTSKDIQHERRLASRAPRRREQDLSGIDMAHITESLEESIASYEHPGYTPHTTATVNEVPQSQTKPASNHEYAANPESEHYAAELANMQAIREAQAKRRETFAAATTYSAQSGKKRRQIGRAHV